MALLRGHTRANLSLTQRTISDRVFKYPHTNLICQDSPRFRKFCQVFRLLKTTTSQTGVACGFQTAALNTFGAALPYGILLGLKIASSARPTN